MNAIRLCVLQLCGLFLIVMGTSAMVGHVFNLPVLTSLGGGIGMAIPTAICFIVIGISYFHFGKVINFGRKK